SRKSIEKWLMCHLGARLSRQIVYWHYWSSNVVLSLSTVTTLSSRRRAQSEHDNPCEFHASFAAEPAVGESRGSQKLRSRRPGNAAISATPAIEGSAVGCCERGLPVRPE